MGEYLASNLNLHATVFNFSDYLFDLISGSKVPTFKHDQNGFFGGQIAATEYGAVVFVDNHDTQRQHGHLSYKNGSIYELATVILLASNYGYLKVMSSYRFSDFNEGPPSEPVHGPSGLNCGPGQPWVCEHRWPAIANMVSWRHTAQRSRLSGMVRSKNGEAGAGCRGSACMAVNLGSAPWVVQMSVLLPPGRYCNIIVSAESARCPTIHVDTNGKAEVDVPSKSAVAFHLGQPAD